MAVKEKEGRKEMRDGSAGIFLLIGFLIGVVTIIIVCETKFTRDTKVIELGCAYYDSTTGDFTLKEKGDKK